MKAAADFIKCLGRALDTMAPTEENTGLVTALEFVAYDALCQLLKLEAEPVLLLRQGKIVLAQRPLTPLAGQNWTDALAEAGIERIQVSQGVTREEFGDFVDVLRALMCREIAGVSELSQRLSAVGMPNIAFGWTEGRAPEGHPHSGDEVSSRFHREIEATEWLLGQAARGERISHGLAYTVTNSLYAAMRREESVLRLLLPLEEVHRYPAVHAMNAALLVMSVAEVLESSESYVRSLGESAILHDVGQARIPRNIVRKPGALSPAEWDIVKRHPADGARMLLDSGPGMSLAATVAYEHHIGYDGNGYPAGHSTRRLNPATQLLQVCNVYDALRTRRPFRDRWTTQQIKTHLLAESGRSLHPDAVLGLTTTLERDPLARSEHLRSQG